VSTFYQPTNYDGDLTLIYLFIIEKFFFYTMIIVDNYFWKAILFFTTIILITPVSKAGHLRIMNKKKVLNELSHEEEHMNKVITGVRGKAENLNSISLLFRSLFYEDKKQHEKHLYF
jgi:hypothetical protein